MTDPVVLWQSGHTVTNDPIDVSFKDRPGSHWLIRTPEELIESVPYLLGFHPEHSIIAIALCPQSKRIQLLVRLGLDNPLDAYDIAQAITGYLDQLTDGEIFLLIYDQADGVFDLQGVRTALPHQGLIDEIALYVQSRKFLLLDALYINPQRWWSYVCSNNQCCPPEGIATRQPIGTISAVAAAATAAGLIAMPNRAALAALFTPASRWELDLITNAVQQAEATLVSTVQSGITMAAMRRLALHNLTTTIAELPHNQREITHEHAAYLLVALLDPELRDQATQWDCRPMADNALALWIQLASRSSPPYNIAPLFLAAWVAWRTGQAALSRIALEQLFLRDPQCRVALLLEEALDRGINPHAVVRSENIMLPI